MKKIVLYIGLILALPSEAQEDSFYQLQYREKVLHYNQDIKAANYQVSMRTEIGSGGFPAQAIGRCRFQIHG